MPHELSLDANGEAEMFYVGDTPWHGLGTALDHPATSKEAIEAARLNWKVETQPLYRRNEAGDQIKAVDNAYALVRTDTDTVLNSHVTDSYEPLQNVDAFQFFDDVIGQGQAVYHTAMALREGRVIAILAKLPESLEAVPGDQIDKYILLSTSHDGSLSLQLSITPVRVVCANTLRVALNNTKHMFRIKHTSSIHDRVVEAREALELSDVYFNLMMEGVNKLVQTPMPPEDVKMFADALFNINPNSDSIHAYSERARDNVFELFYAGRGQDIKGVRDTAYAALNAATEHVDNFSRVSVRAVEQDSREAQDARLYKSWFSRGQDTRNHAWGLLQNYAINGNQAFLYTPRQQASEWEGWRYATSPR